ncbi:hypothetical protein ACFOW6_02155 [Fodinicurvata halophila]|uniref:Uncharacterized protein n=1 Tax=Fodinicurvata halophila TaxID=1419723 RepID=A0ABV8UHA2_9PROT
MTEDSNSASSVTLRLCPADQAETAGKTLASFTDTAGARKVLTVAETPGEAEACSQLQLPVDRASLRWAGFVADITDSTESIVLTGPADQVDAEGLPQFTAETTTTAERRADRSVPRIAPLARNLLPLLSARPFGTEERVTLEKTDDGLTIRCQAGSQPAGVLLEDPERDLPELDRVDLRVAAEHSGGFQFALYDPLKADSQNPTVLGALPQGSTFMTLPQPNPVHGPRYPLAFSLHCPNSGGEARLNSIELAPRVSSEPVDSPLTAWAWHPDLWQSRQESVLEQAEALDLDALYISVDYQDGRLQNREVLSTFIRRADERGLDVWAVEGDPAAVLESERPIFVRRAEAIAAYNRNAAPQSRLAGVQYDIEPYLLTGFNLDRPAWLDAFRNTLEELTAVLDMPVELALPFWFAGNPQIEARFLDRLPDSVVSIAVMSYRTQPSDLQEIATPFLDWGTDENMPIRIGLEAGPLSDELHLNYRPAEQGELWALELGGHNALVLLDEPARNPHGTSWRYSHRHISPGDRLSFNGDIQAMQLLMSEVEPKFQVWPSFHGFALHGVL